MSIVGHVTGRIQLVRGRLAEGLVEATAEGNAEGLDFVAEGPNTQWTESEAAEGLTGEVAVNGIDMDLDPGLVFAGPVGSAIKVSWNDVDVRGAPGNLPAAGDEFSLLLFRNNELVGQSDEGAASEFDTATAEFNGQAVVTNMQTGDVLRFGLLSHSGNSDGVDLEIIEGGGIIIT